MGAKKRKGLPREGDVWWATGYRNIMEGGNRAERMIRSAENGPSSRPLKSGQGYFSLRTGPLPTKQKKNDLGKNSETPPLRNRRRASGERGGPAARGVNALFTKGRYREG